MSTNKKQVRTKWKEILRGKNAERKVHRTSKDFGTFFYAEDDTMAIFSVQKGGEYNVVFIQNAVMDSFNYTDRSDPVYGISGDVIAQPNSIVDIDIYLKATPTESLSGHGSDFFDEYGGLETKEILEKLESKLKKLTNR